MSMISVVKIFGVIWWTMVVAENMSCLNVMVLVDLYICNDLIMNVWDVFGCGENGMSCLNYVVKLGDEGKKLVM